jgi:hypothetical protein
MNYRTPVAENGLTKRLLSASLVIPSLARCSPLGEPAISFVESAAAEAALAAGMAVDAAAGVAPAARMQRAPLATINRARPSTPATCRRRLCACG